MREKSLGSLKKESKGVPVASAHFPSIEGWGSEGGKAWSLLLVGGQGHQD